MPIQVKYCHHKFEQNESQSLTGNFMRQRSLGSAGTGSMDLETWTKNHAVRMNQENALIAQLAQMAPHRRNQLVRDVTNGNASAANELVTRLLRDLASSPHGQLAFGGQLQQQAALLSMLDQSGGSRAHFSFNFLFHFF
jgi:hypothetical protein